MLDNLSLDCDEPDCDANIEADYELKAVDPAAISDEEAYTLTAGYAAALGWQVGHPMSDPTSLDFCPDHRGRD